jgi:hypothetical protein
LMAVQPEPLWDRRDLSASEYSWWSGMVGSRWADAGSQL